MHHLDSNNKPSRKRRLEMSATRMACTTRTTTTCGGTTTTSTTTRSSSSTLSAACRRARCLVAPATVVCIVMMMMTTTTTTSSSSWFTIRFGVQAFTATTPMTTTTTTTTTKSISSSSRTTRANTTHQRRAAVLLATDTTTATSTTTSTSRPPHHQRRVVVESYYEYDGYYNTANDEAEKTNDDDDWTESIQSFKTLQQQTNQEVLDTATQDWIDQGAYFDVDASWLERTAVASIPDQLPRAAVRALEQQEQQQQQQLLRRRQVDPNTKNKSRSNSSSSSSSRKKKSSGDRHKKDEETHAVATTNDMTTKTSNTKRSKRQKSSPLHHSTHRVTPEQEVELARIIQQGAALHKLRQEYGHDKSGNNKDVSNLMVMTMSAKEWADLAGLTTKELRRQITAYRRAKHELVTANMGLVHAVVNRMPFTSNVHKDEMIQEGSLGLLRAAELFDPSKGLRFSTYAVVWIKGVLRNSHTTELVKLPSREKIKWNKIQRAQRDILLQQQNPLNHDYHHHHHHHHLAGDAAAAVVVDNDGATSSSSSMTLRVPLEELAAATGYAPAEILLTHRRMTQAQKVLSLDYQYTTQSRSGDNNELHSNTMEKSAASADDDDLAERTQLQADVLAAMARNLDAREGRLMRLRYGLGADGRTRTLQECAEAMGLSYTRVQQLSIKCLQKLRQAAEAESLEEYLLTIA